MRAATHYATPLSLKFNTPPQELLNLLVTEPDSSKPPQRQTNRQQTETPSTGGPTVSGVPHRQPFNWQSSTLLREVREKRGFTIGAASQCLPGISAKAYEEWESGKRMPLGPIQTFVIWKLNTSP